MKKFTKLFMALALLFVVVSANAKTVKAHATFENPSETSAKWNAETNTFTWPQTSYNQIRNIGLPTGDITGYKKLVIDCDIVSGEKFRILFYKGGSNKTLWVKQSGVTEFNIKEELEKLGEDYNEYLLGCTEICLSGSNEKAPGEVKVNDMYLETYDDEGQKTYATFENPSETSAKWNAETNTFTWPQTSYNQIRNIGLPTGDISGYKKLVIDCDIVSGEKFRILFYKGGSNKTLWVKQSGVTEFNIKEELEKLGEDYNEYLLGCTEICLSGSNEKAPGEVKVNSLYLETYPENEQVDIPEIVYEEDPGKPAGDYVDLTTAFPSLQPRIGIGEDTHPIVLGNGDVVVGARSKDVIADLSAYSKMTLVTSPNVKLVIYMNHEIEARQNPGDYTPEEAGKYVCQDVQADEKGIIEFDLTAYDKQDLNGIVFPWDNNNKGTVWYILLTQLGESVTIGEAGYATFSSTKAVNIPDGVEAYAADLQGEKVVLTKVDAVPANTGVILKATPGKYVLPFAESAAAIETDLLVSDGSITGNASTIYVLANGEKGIGFYKLANEKKVEAGKAYLEIAGSARGFIGFEGATGINEVNVNKAAAKTGKIYNLNGQIVSKPSKGLFIVDGKVVSF